MSDPMLQFFEYKHLPITLEAYSKPFCDLANELAALRKLLEAKDCAVRATLYKETN